MKQGLAGLVPETLGLAVVSKKKERPMTEIKWGVLSLCSNIWRGASLIAQLVKNLPAVQETPVRFLGWEDPLEKGKSTHSSILAWRIPWGCKESDMTEQLSRHFTIWRNGKKKMLGLYSRSTLLES